MRRFFSLHFGEVDFSFGEASVISQYMKVESEILGMNFQE